LNTHSICIMPPFLSLRKQICCGKWSKQ
jgi:hypothetical protein